MYRDRSNYKNDVSSRVSVVQVRAQGFGRTTERDVEDRIALTDYIMVGTTQFGLMIEEDLQLRDN